MPTTDGDDTQMQRLAPRTAVRHIRHPEYGVGIVGHQRDRNGQVAVFFDNITRWCYPTSLRPDSQQIDVEQVADQASGEWLQGTVASITIVPDDEVASGTPSEVQAIHEMAYLLHEVRSGCTDVCRAGGATIEHWTHARAVFKAGWRPAWWFHSPDGQPNGRPAIPYNQRTGRAL